MRSNIILIFLFCIPLLSYSQSQDTLALFHGSRQDKTIALTFDACPSFVKGGYDTLVIQALVDSMVPATLFLSGRWIYRHRAVAKHLASFPQLELANHSYSHPHFPLISADSIRNELQRTETLLHQIAGKSPKLYRPPFGETDPRVEHTIDSLGFTSIMYDVASGDPDSTFSANRLLRGIIRSARNGSIIVMHMNGKGWHTAEVLPHVIGELRKKDYRFVKVSEMLGAKNKNNHKATKQ
jgi:peptidoglycan-N-acetylglucosamine deacetylase